MRGVVVHEVAVGPLAVAAQPLSVVADDHDDGLLVDPVAPQPGDEPPHLLVGEGDLAVVEAGEAASAELREERLGGLVGGVGVVEVDPGEEGTLLVALQPGRGPRP